MSVGKSLGRNKTFQIVTWNRNAILIIIFCILFFSFEEKLNKNSSSCNSPTFWIARDVRCVGRVSPKCYWIRKCGELGDDEAKYYNICIETRAIVRCLVESKNWQPQSHTTVSLERILMCDGLIIWFFYSLSIWRCVQLYVCECVRMYECVWETTCVYWFQLKMFSLPILRIGDETETEYIDSCVHIQAVTT